MNEQIEDLLYHAGLTAQGCWDELGTYEQEAIKKLAELIVKECVQVLDTCHVDIAEDADLEDNNTWVNATMNTTVNFCMGRVKQHFGVEE